MVMPAPGLFSTTIDWPRRGESLSAIARATMSTPPPGGNGAMKRMVLAGYGWPSAGGAPASSRAATARRRRALTFLSLGFEVLFADDLAVAREIRIDQLLQLGRRGALRHRALPDQLLAHSRVGDDFSHIRIEFTNNGLRRAGRREQRDPRARLAALHARLGNRRHVGQRGIAVR